MADLSQLLSDEHFVAWLAAVANVNAGAGHARIVCAGDSTTEGVAASTRQDTYPHQLIDILVSAGVNAKQGAIWGHTNEYVDDRVSEGSGWTTPWASSGWGPPSRQWRAATSATGKLSFTFPHSIDTIRVFYARTTTSGSFTVDVGGASLGTAVTANAGGNAHGYTDFACSSGLHTINVNPPTVGEVFIMGVEAWLSTDSCVLVSNAGAGSASTGSWITANVPWAKLPVFDLYEPDLTVVSLGIIDALSATSAATVELNLMTLVAKAQLYGDVLLCTMVPSSEAHVAGVIASEAAYMEKMVDVSTATSCALLDLHHLFGGSWASADASGLMEDAYHPNDAGYGMMAQWVADVLPASRAAAPTVVGSSCAGSHAFGNDFQSHHRGFFGW